MIYSIFFFTYSRLVKSFEEATLKGMQLVSVLSEFFGFVLDAFGKASGAAYNSINHTIPKRLRDIMTLVDHFNSHKLYDENSPIKLKKPRLAAEKNGIATLRHRDGTYLQRQLHLCRIVPYRLADIIPKNLNRLELAAASAAAAAAFDDADDDINDGDEEGDEHDEDEVDENDWDGFELGDEED